MGKKVCVAWQQPSPSPGAELFYVGGAKSMTKLEALNDIPSCTNTTGQNQLNIPVLACQLLRLVCVNAFTGLCEHLTLDAPFEEGFAALAGPHPVVVA